MSAAHSRTGRRLDAATRRVQILEAATEEFAERGWGGATTSSISRIAVVNEALLFRYVGTKQQMYLAAIDDVWEQIQAEAQKQGAGVSSAEAWRIPGRAFLAVMERTPAAAQLWARALSEATGIEEIDSHLSARMRNAHEWVADALQESVDAGGLRDDVPVTAQAWIIISLGWLGIVGARLDPSVRPHLDEILREHRAWITGSPECT